MEIKTLKMRRKGDAMRGLAAYDAFAIDNGFPSDTGQTSSLGDNESTVPAMNKQKNVLRVATCQFAVEPDIAHNRRWVLKQIAQAAKRDADVVHFSETALSGYAGVDIPNIQVLDAEELRAATHDVMAAAKEHQVWVVLGSTHGPSRTTVYTSSIRRERLLTDTINASAQERTAREQRWTFVITHPAIGR